MYRSSLQSLGRAFGFTRVHLTRTSSAMAEAGYEFETLRVTVPSEYVYQVELNRPEKRNAMNKAFWSEMVTCFNKISGDSNCRSVILSGAGKMFTAGLDFKSIGPELMESGGETDVGRKGFHFRNVVNSFQESFTVIEKCLKPVIAAVHDGCVGGGIDMISACDIRYCTQDAWFQVKEIDLAIIADVGALQRFPKIVGNDSLVRELCYTARQMKADEALQCELVSRVLTDRESMLAAALETAKLIASKSPVAVQGTKITLVYARDHSVADGLQQVATMNQSMIQSEDVVKAITGAMTKEPVVFSKL